MNESQPDPNNPANKKSNVSKQEKPKKGLPATGRVAIWNNVITVIGSLLIAVVGTAGTILMKKSDLKEISDQIPKVQSDLAIAKTDAAQVLSSTTGLNVPSGTILPYGGPITKANEEIFINNGWLPCDGREVLQTKYPVLYARIRDSWGKGNSVDTFNLPDLRGLFLRGVDPEGSNDIDYKLRFSSFHRTNEIAGPVVGSVQTDGIAKHSHPLTKTIYVHGRSFKGDSGSDRPLKDSSGNVFIDRTGETGGSETRPKNAYVYYIIKY